MLKKKETQKNSLSDSISKKLTGEVIVELFEIAKYTFYKTKKIQEKRFFFRNVHESIEKTEKQQSSLENIVRPIKVHKNILQEIK